MRKHKSGRKLHRKKDQRKALLKSIASSVILKEKIKTTEAKAKEVSELLERFITQAKKNDLHSKRMIFNFFALKVAEKLINKIALRYKERKGGYVRIIKLGPRKSDGAKMAIIELVK